jgi:hypothetical protein
MSKDNLSNLVEDDLSCFHLWDRVFKKSLKYWTEKGFTE